MKSKTTFWELITKYKISIPIIQRDYVYGREHEAEKRNKFVNKIHEHITNNKSLHLDFIFGQVEFDTFSPIDGQEKLTTLFLLHWYFSLKKDIPIDERKVLDKFVYDTRISSRKFCYALIHEEVEMPSHQNKDALADAIRNRFWYKRAWDNDPTIQSMLVMIDTIHQKFNDIKEVSLWDYLTEESIISFDLLNLSKKGYKLTDELYIKMNARGKQLTSFENFKANFIQFLGNQYKGQKRLHPIMGEVSYVDYFSYKIEKEWTDLFWAFREGKHTIDDNFSAYLQFITQLLYVKEDKKSKTKNFTNNLAQYIEVYSNEENLMFLFDSLNSLFELVIYQQKMDKESIDNFIDSITEEAILIASEVDEEVD